ncbi:2-hydroxy-3-oxopropionate reductase [Pirellulimonas nuda]|uniref:2-hydroxy-3-oxopropionate reductase n=1 Tax=Pirellulimonas nuda TaxID=2528009 RepID=A0A518D964_9BACT|nr:NAD(P)-dependent oxidoreductase [Pirellulimonas nuda]QDU88018.1 2-hydroxy-3-oxopropionate reductase [Pirellulimonas nuda]
MRIAQVHPQQTRVGWIGLGVMGRSMAAHLQQAGYALTLFTRTKAKAQDLLDAGAAWADTPASVAERSDVVFSIVGFPSDVRQVILGADGALSRLREGGVLVDMTTSEPELAKEIYEKASQRGVHSVDAPVSGGDVGARNAALSIMIGGDAEVVQALNPLWDAMGKTIVHQGPAGAGQHTKMVNQTLIATGIIGVCEALLYAHKAGLDIQAVLKSVSGGAAGSWSLTNYGPRIVANDLQPGFYVEHFLKDMRIALQEAARMKLALPGLGLAQQLYTAMEAQGDGRLGIQGLQVVLAKLSGVDWSSRE